MFLNSEVVVWFGHKLSDVVCEALPLRSSRIGCCSFFPRREVETAWLARSSPASMWGCQALSLVSAPEASPGRCTAVWSRGTGGRFLTVRRRAAEESGPFGALSRNTLQCSVASGPGERVPRHRRAADTWSHPQGVMAAGPDRSRTPARPAALRATLSLCGWQQGVAGGPVQR